MKQMADNLTKLILIISLTPVFISGITIFLITKNKDDEKN